MLEKDLGIFIIVTNHFGSGNNGKELLMFADDDIFNLEISKFQDLDISLMNNEQYNLQDVIDQNQMREDSYLLYQYKVGNLKMSRKNLEVFIKDFYNQFLNLNLI